MRRPILANCLIMAVFAIAAAEPNLLRAQQADSTSGHASTLLQFSVPEAPAFTFLGVSPTKVTRASTPRDLAASVLNGVDSTGRVLSGFALGATLWQLVPGMTIPLSTYQSDRFSYAEANTQFSLGTARASGDTASTNAALGLRSTLYDDSDPMLDSSFVNAYTNALIRCVDLKTKPGPALHAQPGTKADSSRAVADSAHRTLQSPIECASQAADSLRKGWLANHWNGKAVSVGAAVGWRFQQSAWDKRQPLGWSSWLTAGYPLPHSMQLLGQLQLDHRLPIDTLKESEMLSYGFRLIHSSTDYNFFAEGVWSHPSKVTAVTSSSRGQWSAGIEFKASDAYWISTGLGKRYNALNKPDKIVVLAGLRWGISSTSRLSALR